MKLEDFAAKYRLKVRREEDGEPVIPGNFGRLYQHDAETLGLMFLPGRPRLWPHARRKLETAGLTIWQNGDDEGSALFDPANTVQARLTLKVIRAKPRRTPSVAQLKTLEKARKSRRIAPKRCAEALVAP